MSPTNAFLGASLILRVLGLHTIQAVHSIRDEKLVYKTQDALWAGRCRSSPVSQRGTRKSGPITRHSFGIGCWASSHAPSSQQAASKPYQDTGPCLSGLQPTRSVSLLTGLRSTLLHLQFVCESLLRCEPLSGKCSACCSAWLTDRDSVLVFWPGSWFEFCGAAGPGMPQGLKYSTCRLE